MKQTVVFDFDGVIHSYRSGWKGDTVIPDPPVPGIRETISKLRQNYLVVVVSSRTRTQEGRNAVNEWLLKYNIEVDDVAATKPPAIVYVDDRAICFDGKSEELIEKIDSFKPWYAD